MRTNIVAWAAWLAQVSTLVLGIGCQPSLPDPTDWGPPTETAEPSVQLEPEADFSLAPPVVRFRFHPGDSAEIDLKRLLFVEGHVGDGHLRQVVNSDVSETLAERVLPTLAWKEPDGTAVLAPTHVLTLGATYGVLSGEPALLADLSVTNVDPVPLLMRTWPSAETSSFSNFAIVCGESGPFQSPSGALFSPGNVLSTVEQGIWGGLGSNCLRLNPILGASAPWFDKPNVKPRSPLVPPPLLTLPGGQPLRVDPTPIQLGNTASPTEVKPLLCEPPSVPFGPGCVWVEDDRLVVVPPEVPLLWEVRGGSSLGDSVLKTAPGEPWKVTGLTPNSLASFSVVALDEWGEPTASGSGAPKGVHNLTLQTLPPMPHVILNEVFANPLGPEPDQEWVELYNDGAVPADLTGYILSDLGGSTTLPAVALAPGGYALVVNSTFLEDDEIDPSPAPETLLIHVEHLGKGGLKNDGEPLKLVNAAGEVVSKFPMLPKPKAGLSVSRIYPSVPDGTSSGFQITVATPGSPNATSGAADVQKMREPRHLVR
ncbi:MAG: lamin tail domain-containing protein [Polyangiaceae bacterium]|nr:lamin tail domain-containing protein [Polyangiaceae bacterium]